MVNPSPSPILPALGTAGWALSRQRQASYTVLTGDPFDKNRVLVLTSRAKEAWRKEVSTYVPGDALTVGEHVKCGWCIRVAQSVCDDAITSEYGYGSACAKFGFALNMPGVIRGVKLSWSLATKTCS